MITIAIIEDSREDYEFLAEGITEYSEKSGEAVSVRRYESALRFLDEYKFNYDIVFMDIELPDINGVPASEKLATKAIEQIDDNQFDAGLRQHGVNNVFKLGIAFCGKEVKVACGE